MISTKRNKYVITQENNTTSKMNHNRKDTTELVENNNKFVRPQTIIKLTYVDTRQESMCFL